MRWDAIVLGAGPAGSVTACELARRGCSVLLLDKATFPRMKVCGCCMNGAAIGTLEQLGLGHILNGAVPLERVAIATRATTAGLRLPRGVALSRSVLDARLIEAAVAAGAVFRPGALATIRGTSPADERSVDISGQGSPETARVVIHAGGLASAGSEPSSGSRVGAGIVIPGTEAPEYFRAGTIYMATARGGYVGLVRVEDSRLDVAAAFDIAFVKSAGGLGCAAVAILREIGWPVPAGLAQRTWKGTPELTRRPLKLADHRYFVVGDAAGYVEPFTGEGMAWAVMSAALLAPIAARAARSWDERLAREWEATYPGVVGRRQLVCRIVSRVLRSPPLTRLAVHALRQLPILSRPVVSALNRPVPVPHGLPA